MQSSATTVEEYLAQLPEDRRKAIEIVRATVLERLPDGYEETMQYGMIAYVVPHSRFPAGYHCNPQEALTYAGIANQKNHMSVYLMAVYGNHETAKAFHEAYAASGKKLKMGKSCVSFRNADDLALDVIGDSIAKVSLEAYVEAYEAVRSASKRTTKRGVSA